MDNIALVDHLDKETFSREDIYIAAVQLEPDFKQTNMRNLMEKLQDSGSIIRVGRNQYSRNSREKQIYIGNYSDEAAQIREEMESSYKHLDYQVWELNWFNEFCNHLIGQNRIIVDVENDACEFVFLTLVEQHDDRLLLRPTIKELQYYTVPDAVLITRLASETPRNKIDTHSISLERLIVEMFANRTIRSMLPVGDYPDILERMFEKYAIDQSKLFRYARRRNREREIMEFIKKNTNIKLIVEG
ncbi:MAG: hypothetical protein HUJ57_03270 [Erysipelotrichaceae bacterium]|nr:hypothetical protein [Erysipelotrichaceae bacterium]